MKTRATLTLLLAAAAISAAPVSAQNLTGTWQITSEGRRGSVTQTLVLTQNGNALTGTITPAFGGGGRGRGGGGGGGGGGAGRGAPEPVAISDGTVNGASFSFAMTFEFGGRGSFTQTFSGTYEGDAMQGSIDNGRGGEPQPFTGTRHD